ncbi:MAG: hypothetical protein AAF846_10785 [Chloroflexota bacterium]
MTFLLNLVMATYPQTWRERYEEEFRAMLEQCELSISDWLDMFFTALETRSGYTRRELMKDLLNRLTGLIALVSALGFGSVFLIPHEDTAEFMLTVSPILSVLLIPAMHRILKIHRPKMSFAVMMTAILAVLLIVFAMVANLMTENILIVGSFTTMSLILIGIWLISVNGLAISTGTLPLPLGMVGIFAGLGWIVTVTTTMVTSLTEMSFNGTGLFGAFYGVMLMALLIGYFVWAIGTGLYFISGKVSRKLQLVY